MENVSKIGGAGLAGQHGILTSVALHLLPGILIVAVYYFVGTSIAKSAGYPSLFGFFLAALLVLLPFQIGVIWFAAKNSGDDRTFGDLIGFRERLSRPLLLLIVFGLFSWAFAVVLFFGGIDGIIQQSLFSWVPDEFQLYGFSPASYGLTTYNIATILNLISFGLLFPFVEEIYFRGFLLPRMEKFGSAAPFANSALFVLYHLWTPWQFVSRMLFVTPMVWLVWRKRSVEIGIWTHCLLNSFGIILSYVSFMAA